jgi:hypothetical protein
MTHLLVRELVTSLDDIYYAEYSIERIILVDNYRLVNNIDDYVVLEVQFTDDFFLLLFRLCCHNALICSIKLYYF